MRIILLLSLILREIHGFDEYTSCDSMGRSSRQLDLPSSCDLSRDNFCFDKGHHYPDKAIRRFLQENLGLMKRMSSDMDGREVVREMRSGFNMWTQTEHYEDEEYSLVGEEEGRASNFQINMMPPGENIFNGLRYNIKYGSGLTTIQNVKDDEVKNTPVSQSTSTTKTTTSQTTMIVTSSQSSSSVSSTSSVSSSSTSSSDYYTDYTTQPVPSIFTTARKDTSNDYIEPSTVTEQIQTATTLMDNTDQETTYDMQSRETPTDPPVTEEEQVYADPDEYYTDYFNDINLQPVSSPQVDNSEYEDIIEEILTEEIIDNNIHEEDDYEADEIEYVGESVNACEVIDTIEAPYYANNTRNETLALLNLYPFEQYVHMERCRAEGDEMLCRAGCRCEQQYRLHRLLAFDPKNECRGIFSDWFRFPSYCICKCYNSARQLKELASRNPKAQKLGQSSSSRRRGPGPSESMESSRLNNHRLMTVSGMDNMPAVFPYEGLAMITDEQNQQEYENIRNRKDFRLPRRMETPYETHIQDSTVMDNTEDILIEKIAQEHLDNTVESDQLHYKKNMKKARFLDDTFFYNQPIVDFKLSDGTMGSVEQVPRK